MLTITQVNYIRELYFCEGKSYTDIIKMTGRNYRTVKKYIEMEDFNEKKHKAQRPNKSDVLRPIIKKWLSEDKSRHHKQRHTAKRIYDRLKAEHGEILRVSHRTVRRIVKEEREKIYSVSDSYLRLEHPGGEAQVDFGTFEAYENGAKKKFHELILSFPQSNAGFAVVTRSQTREALFEGLVSIFKFMEYVPTTIWFDQMSTAALRVRDDKGVVKIADAMMRFATHYGFAVRFCNPNSGHEKGNVENKVGTIRRNMFVPEPVIRDLGEFNLSLLGKCLKDHQDMHYRRKKPVAELFEEEKKLMVPFNKIPFDTSRYELRKVNKYGLVEFARCRYSVSPKYVGQWVNLRVMANKIEIYTRNLDEKITSHPRLFKKGQESINYVSFIDMIKVRPRALKYSGIYSLLPKTWKAYLDSLDKETLREAFKVLKTILLEEDLDYADKVLRETMEHDSLSPEAILVTFKRFHENLGIYEEKISYPSDLPLYEVDTSAYDQLLRRDAK